MNIMTWAEEKMKKMHWYDMSMTKLCLVALGLWLATLWPWFTTVNPWIYFCIWVGLAVIVIARMLR
ncbi:MAG: hypothetical protein ABIH41_03685 [Nanoarchaeota archaeon]